MYHVLNGDATLHGFRRAGVPGEVAVWRDMLSEGPVPRGLRTDADWVARAAEVERRYDHPTAGAYLAEARAALRVLADAGKRDEVVLWFEQDLCCLLNLAFVMARLADSPPRRVALVMPEQPLGSREGPSLRKLWDARVDATDWLDQGTRLWQAYASPDPLPLQALAQAASDLPFWERGLRLHLARFPSARNGLAAAEEATLRVLRDEGELAFGELFQRVLEEPGAKGLGFGDVQFAAMLRDLARGPAPLVTLENADDRRLDMTEVLAWQAELTPQGQRVLRGEEDAVRARGVDRWLGGVHLQGHGPVWRWDARAARLIHA